MINQNIINDLKSQPALTKENLQIIACAGSGKTEFISHRIAYIIAEEIAKPENIVAFTFTEKAAEELKFRIRSKIRGLNGNQVHNILNILHKVAQESGKMPTDDEYFSYRQTGYLE